MAVALFGYHWRRSFDACVFSLAKTQNFGSSRRFHHYVVAVAHRLSWRPLHAWQPPAGLLQASARRAPDHNFSIHNLAQSLKDVGVKIQAERIEVLRFSRFVASRKYRSRSTLIRTSKENWAGRGRRLHWGEV
jgi:hypothetical protein